MESSGLRAPVGSDGHCRARFAEDGAGHSASYDQMPAEMGHFDGRVRYFRQVFNNYALVQGVNQVILSMFMYRAVHRVGAADLRSYLAAREDLREQGSLKRV